MGIYLEKAVAAVVALGMASLLLAGFFLLQVPAASANAQPAEIPAPSAAVSSIAEPRGPQTVIFAGGCFWGVQGVFQHVKGVTRAVSGYAGGTLGNPDYEAVSTGRTGHAESVQVTYDPAQVSYATLLQVFFSVVHDPTELNRQGPDRGTQYRSAIFTTTGAQLEATKAYIAQLQAAKVFNAPIVTQVQGTTRFYRAEGHHQDYLTLNPDAAYIRYNDAPKIAALKQEYPSLYRDKPVLVGTR